eukprot:jgi/Botrbrau1/21031/Bobra.0144s0043.1
MATEASLAKMEYGATRIAYKGADAGVCKPGTTTVTSTVRTQPSTSSDLQHEGKMRTAPILNLRPLPLTLSLRMGLVRSLLYTIGGARAKFVPL